MKIGLETGRFTTRTIAALLVAAAATVWSPAALGQEGLPPDIIASTTQLGGTQREAIKAFVATHAGNLTNTDSTVLIRARADLLGPLQGPDVGVSFRTAYSEELEKVLQPLIGDDRDIVAVNSLRIAGELSTRQGAALLEKMLTSKKLTVRYAAVAGIGRTFENLGRTAPAMNAEAARSLAGKLAPVLRGETDSNVFDVAVRAVMAAGALDRDGWGSLRDDAMATLAPAISERFQKLGTTAAEPAMMQALIRACSAGRDALALAGGRPLSADTQKLVAAMGGDGLAYVQRLIQAKVYPTIMPGDAEAEQQQKIHARTTAADLSAAAYAAVTFANDGLGGPPLPIAAARPLSDLPRTAQAQDDAKFLEGLRDLIGDNGALSKPPFSFPRGRFTK
ncbi:MAG: hypothetical protein IT436_11755 [Phycisphaerales bacterium]|nr:hypothetical protein [Phycisphaerales bacterium]